LGTRDGAREHRVVQRLLAAEEVGRRTPRDSGRLADLLQGRALEPETREAIFGGDQDRLFCALCVSYAFRGSCSFVVSCRHLGSSLDN
jgi:hypothetical protein